MKERPIIISTQLIPPTLDGRKTMTRRPIKDPRKHFTQYNKGMSIDDIQKETELNLKPNFPCPYGQPGDRLWVRETYCVESNMGIAGNEEYPPPFNDGRPVQHHMDLDWGSFWDQCHYKATDPTPELAYEDTDQPTVRWKPSIFMPRWASRITLEIVNVRVERLQEITEGEAKCEGVNWIKQDIGLKPAYFKSYKLKFIELWDSLYTKKPELQWEASPWVWVVEFEKH